VISRVPHSLIRAAARAVAEAGGDMEDVGGLLEGPVARLLGDMNTSEAMLDTLADLSDEELRDRAGLDSAARP